MGLVLMPLDGGAIHAAIIPGSNWGTIRDPTWARSASDGSH